MKKLNYIFLSILIMAVNVYPVIAKDKQNISECTITFKEDSYEYSGEKIEPDIIVEDENYNELEEDYDYTCSYKYNKNVGNAYVVVKGKGNYKGSKTGYFTIKRRSIKDTNIYLSSTSFTYTSKDIKPSVKVYFNNSKLTKSNYTISYSNNVNPGLAKATIEGKNNFKNKSNINFIILPSTVKNVSVLSANNKINVTYDKIPGVTGYEISINDEIKKITKNKTSYSFTSTTSTYNIKVRAYKVIQSKTYYGSYSKIKTFTN